MVIIGCSCPPGADIGLLMAVWAQQGKGIYLEWVKEYASYIMLMVSWLCLSALAAD